MANEPRKILLVTSEAVPFAKTGGLADVAGALPQALGARGLDCRVILPKYKDIKPELKATIAHKMHFYINLGWRQQYVGVEQASYGGVIYYFIDNEYYFGRDGIYGMGVEEGERYAFFCRAVLEALPHLDFFPDVLHCNDWQSGMIPVLLKTQYQGNPAYREIATVFTVHNLQYQGIFPWGMMADLLALDPSLNRSDCLEFYGSASFMKGGLVFADRINTVSPSYAGEIQYPYEGERLDGLLRARQNALSGILNGIDTKEYDPAADPMIAAPFTGEDLSGKAACKAALQRELGLKEDPSAPVIALISRLTGQKGLDLIECVFDEIMGEHLQFVVLGMGEERYSNMFTWASWRYPGKMAFRNEMNLSLAHRIYAGADLFLMPSLFEPCGLSQMISLRYGALPIARETGGLRDTVFSYNEIDGSGNGFTFSNYNAHDMLYTIRRALFFYREHPEIWRKLQTRAMAGDYSWSRSAADYEALYETALADCRQPAPKASPAAPGASASAAPQAAPAAPSEPAPVAPAAPSQPEAPKKAPAKRAPRKKPAPQKPGDGAAKPKRAPRKKPAPKGEA